MTVPALEFWFEFASTYSYPAAMRIGRKAAARGVGLVWRPFLLGPILAERGMTDSPFNTDPVRGRYMWRDIARLCAAQGLPFARPRIFPQHTVIAARIALTGAEAPWGPAFVRAVYGANFADGADISDIAVLRGALETAGTDPDPVLARAEAPETKAALRAQVARARALGIFGAPSFTIGDELFWGQDRLEAALEFACAGQRPHSEP